MSCFRDVYTVCMNLAGIVSSLWTSCPRIEVPEPILIEAEKIVTEPSAFGEVQEELGSLCIVKALQIQLELHCERAHRGMAEAGVLALFPYPSALVFPLLSCHIIFYHGSGYYAKGICDIP